MIDFDVYMAVNYRPYEQSITDVLKNGSEDSYVFVAPEVIE